MRIATVGLGKIGLPLAVHYASKGHSVTGVDINEETVALVNRGVEPFPGEQDLAELLSRVVKSGLLKATTSTIEAVNQAGAVVVVVPLFVDDTAHPDFRAMDIATRAIGKGLRPGTLVAYETTLPVGTTRNRLVPILEEESGLEAGKDFYVIFSPERVLTGRVFEDLRKYPKLVGGINEISETKGVEFYEEVLDFDLRPELLKPNGVWRLGSPEAAEMAKLAETTYRDVNIGLANQFAVYAEQIGVDFYQVLEACNSQHFSHIHKPGVAVGGHCIPVYPHLYLQGDTSASVVRSAREANKLMPIHVLARVEEALDGLQGKSVAVLGLAYRRGVKEHAFSGAWDLVRGLQARDATPLVHDPLYSQSEIVDLGLESFNLGEVCDAVIIQADHEMYAHLSIRDFPSAKFLADGRNITSPGLRAALPSYVVGIGKP